MSVAEHTDSNPLLSAALLYASLGWRVLPLHTPTKAGCSCRRGDCDSPGKHPRTLHGLKDGTNDTATIERWWSTFPDANVGICTGKLTDGAHLVVVDVDAKSGGLESWDALQEANGKLPDSPTALTGGGGMHLLVRSEKPIPNSASKIAPGIDVRGDGGYIVAPPSVHASGRTYEWEASSDPEHVQLASIPAWLAVLAGQKRANHHAASEPAADTFSEGGRNVALFKLASSLRAKGMSEAEITAALMVSNAQRCSPPLDEVEVQKIIASVCKYPAGRSPEYEARARRFRVVEGGGGTEPNGPAANDDTEQDVVHQLFDRGDSVEIAQRLLLDLGKDSPEPIVHDRNAFWRYASTGVWESIDDAEVYRTIARYAGAPVRGAKNGAVPLKLSNNAITGAIKAAAAFAAKPGFFNDAPAGICFANGFVVVERGKVQLIPHSPSQRTLHAMPFEFAPHTRAPRWIQFLEEVFTRSSEEDRADKMALLQEQAGAALLGMATRYATCLVLTGEGANGKSVYLQVIKALFPAGSTASIAPQLWENRFYLAELAGIRLNAVAELPDRDILDSEAFKAVISGDATMVARKNQRPFNLVPTAAHLLACNALPGTKDQSDGFWRRFAVVPFDRTFAVHERDADLAATLIRTELPGIAAWAIEGAARLERQAKFTVPESSASAKDEWQMDSDQCRQFIQECTSPGGQTNPTRLYEAFSQWAKKTGHAGMNQRKFGVRLKKLVGQNRANTERHYPVSIRPEWAPSREGWR